MVPYLPPTVSQPKQNQQIRTFGAIPEIFDQKMPDFAVIRIQMASVDLIDA